MPPYQEIENMDASAYQVEGAGQVAAGAYAGGWGGGGGAGGGGGVMSGMLTPYPFDPTGFTLLNGRMVNPATDTPTADDCTPYQCGVNPSDSAPREWCSFWGRSGAYSCADTTCAPWADQLGCATPGAPVANAILAPAVMPSPTTMKMPSPVGTAQAVTAPSSGPMPVIPRAFNQPLPSIVQSAPVDVSVPACDPVTAWVSNNPLWAGLMLAGVAWLLMKK